MNKVSIIITTKNEEKTIARLLESIKKQTCHDIEIILVDNSSTDTTVKLARNYTKQVYNFGPERSAQRNYGAKKAKGNFLLFLDADMELTPKVVEECLNVVQSNESVGVIIPEESVALNFWEKIKAFERSFYNEDGDDSTDAARFFRKSVFDKVGGYDEKLTGPEDWDLPERMKKKGYKISRIKTVIKHHEKITSIFSLMQKKYYYALNSSQYLKNQNISPISPKTIYFLRPVFYTKWRKIISNPLLSLGMVIMFILELLSGGLGYIIGKVRYG